MTDDEALALAVRLVACKHFRPMPGMRDLQGRTWTPDLLWRWNRTIDRPDLRDPATLGCVLALVREAWGKPNGHIVFHGACGSSANGWRFEWSTTDGQFGGGIQRYSLIEAEALVVALEAKP